MVAALAEGDGDAATLRAAFCRSPTSTNAFFPQRARHARHMVRHAGGSAKPQKIDADDMEFHAQALLAVLEEVYLDRRKPALLALARLGSCSFPAAAVRYAAALSEDEGRAAIALYKKMPFADIGELIKE